MLHKTRVNALMLAARDGHSSGMRLAPHLQQPTRTANRRHTIRDFFPAFARTSPRRSYSVLLPVGFAMPSPLPETRCALTAPFHPCGSLAGGRGTFSVALSLRLPSPDVIRHRMSMEPGLSSRAAFRHLARAAVRPTDSTEVSFFAREIKETRIISLTNGAACRAWTDPRARRRARDGNGAGTP